MEAEPKPSNSKISVRKSAKRVDNVISNSNEFIAAVVTKDGLLSLQVKDKWRPFYFALCGGVLYWKKRESSTSVLGEIHLKGATIQKTPTLTTKSNFAFTIKLSDKEYNLSADKESIQDEWLTALTENSDAPVSTAPQGSSKKDSRILRAQKKVGGSVATTAAGKKIIKEALGNEGYKGVSVVKKVVAAVDGKKRATEIEDSIIKLGVKLVLLAKNKDLTIEDLKRHKVILKKLCDVMAHHVTFAFEYQAGPDGNVHEVVNQFAKDIGGTFFSHLSPKNMQRFNELHAYIASGPIIDALFLDPNLKEQRSQWHYLMKNVSFRLDSLN